MATKSDLIISAPDSDRDRTVGRKTVLFFAEAVTLAHFGRPCALARSLDSDRYRVVFACDPRSQRWLQDVPFEVQNIHSLRSDVFLARMSAGRPLFDSEMLRRSVEEDLQLIDDIRPDLVVGDMRWSLAVSAAVSEVPYATVTNAHWCPRRNPRLVVPQHPAMAFLGFNLFQQLVRWLEPRTARRFCEPLNTVRLQYGLPPAANDLGTLNTFGDFTLYADFPDVHPIEGLTAREHYLGHIEWSPPIRLPAWWDSIPADRPVVYVNLGSSGQSELLPVVLRSMARLPVSVIAATAGRSVEKWQRIAPNCRLAEFIDGAAASSRAAVAITNGGSGGSYQALTRGTPVLGIVGNADQHLFMRGVKGFGAGMMLLPREASAQRLTTCIDSILNDDVFHLAAERIEQLAVRTSYEHEFATFLDEVILQKAKALKQNDPHEPDHSQGSWTHNCRRID